MLYTFFQKNSKRLDACEQINTVNKFCVNNEVYEQVMHMTPIAVEIISQNFLDFCTLQGTYLC